MAKKDKKSKKAKKAIKNESPLKAAFDGRGFDVAHKIWLAGVGAYGKAYDAAAEGVGRVSGQSEVLFEDLVKRGEEIETDVRDRLNSNKAVSRMNAQMEKVSKQFNEQMEQARERMTDAAESVQKLGEEQRERLEARMQRMREALGLEGFATKPKKAEKLNAKLDDLEEKVAALRASSESITDDVKARVERLGEEIAAIVGAPKKAKAKAKKRAVKAKAATKATDALGRLAKPMGKVDDLQQIKGVGPALSKKLQEVGIFHFWQIADLTAKQVTALEEDIKFPGKIGREEWKAQAKSLIASA